MVVGVAAALAGFAGGSSADADDMRISKGVWQKFAEYKNKLTPSSDEYFAASSDGGWAWGIDKDQVVKDCQKYAKSTCVVFAHNDEILVPYHVQ
jgi:hypothetical protein